MIYYIPLELCTLFSAAGIDPDCGREAYAYPSVDGMLSYNPSNKHNALWDAQVIKACFDRLTTETPYLRHLATPSEYKKYMDGKVEEIERGREVDGIKEVLQEDELKKLRSDMELGSIDFSEAKRVGGYTILEKDGEVYVFGRDGFHSGHLREGDFAWHWGQKMIVAVGEKLDDGNYDVKEYMGHEGFPADPYKLYKCVGRWDATTESPLLVSLVPQTQVERCIPPLGDIVWSGQGKGASASINGNKIATVVHYEGKYRYFLAWEGGNVPGPLGDMGTLLERVFMEWWHNNWDKDGNLEKYGWKHVAPARYFVIFYMSFCPETMGRGVLVIEQEHGDMFNLKLVEDRLRAQNPGKHVALTGWQELSEEDHEAFSFGSSDYREEMTRDVPSLEWNTRMVGDVEVMDAIVGERMYSVACDGGYEIRILGNGSRGKNRFGEIGSSGKREKLLTQVDAMQDCARIESLLKKRG